MAIKNTAKVVDSQQEVKPAAKFTIERLKANCKELFGVTPCTFAGATCGMTGSYTVEEIKAHIEKWCKTEVK